MKTSTMLLLGGAVLVGYYLSKQRDQAGQTTQGLATPTAPVTSPPFAVPQVVVVQPQPDVDYIPVGWSPSWGTLMGGRGGHHRGGGGHHGGHR